MAAMDGPLTATAAARVPPGSTARRDRITRSYATGHSLLSAPLALLSRSPPAPLSRLLPSSLVASSSLLSPVADGAFGSRGSSGVLLAQILVAFFDLPIIPLAARRRNGAELCQFASGRGGR